MAANEPTWLTSLRHAAVQRPRTQFQKIRWIDLQYLLRERDFLWQEVGDDTRMKVEAMRAEDYRYK